MPIAALRSLLALLALAFVLGAPSAATAASAPALAELEEEALERAKEEANKLGKPIPRSRFDGAGIAVSVSPNEIVASSRGTFFIRGYAREAGTLRITLPAIFTQRAGSGLPYAAAPRAIGRGRLDQAGRVLRLSVASGQEGGVAIRDLGLPSRAYRIGLAVERPSGEVASLGSAKVRVFAPARESEAGELYERNPWARMQVSRLAAIDTTADTDEQSETYVEVAPHDPNIIAVGYNNIDDIQKGPSVSRDGGKTFKLLTQPNDFDVRGEAEAEPGSVSGDPMIAIDPLGNIWYGGLSVENGDGAPSRIYVNRIDPETGEFQPRTVGLDFTNEGQQDKNLMTIDNSPESPTFGRLYIVWNDLGEESGRLQVISFCDTRVAGVPAVERCDEADNWSKPVPVVADEGSFIYADVAVGPDGTVYFTYWDYSAENAIRGTVCRVEPRTACGTQGSFEPPRTVANLDEFPGQGGVAFACPTFAAPGGRIGPVPGVDVDHSNGPQRGRVWVSWGDLRSDSGDTRCDQVIIIGSPPQPTQRTWDVFVATQMGDLPTPAADDATSSGDVGTRVSTDEGSAPAPASGDNTDDFFPWLAVDQSTGQTFVDYYTTAGDGTRRTTDFIVAPVAPGTGTQPVVGERQKVNEVRSDYSTGTTACCIFGNDYGDYTGLAASQGKVVPVWTSRQGGMDDGDALIAVVDSPVQPGPKPEPEPTVTPNPSPSPSPSPSPGPGPGASTTPPTTTTTEPGTSSPIGARRFRFSLAADRMLVRSVRSRGLRVRLRCSPSCSATSTLRASRRVARRLGISSKALGRGRAVRDRAGRTVFRIKLTKAGRRALRRIGARQVRLQLRTVIRDGSGKRRRIVKRRVTVTEPSKRRR